MTYELITDLSESRSFRTRQAITRRDEKETADFFFAVLLTTLILSKNATTDKWAKESFSRAGAFGNFDHFRVSINDLYSLTYIMSNEFDQLTKIIQIRILKLYRDMGQGNYRRGEIEPLTYRIMNMINMSNPHLRMVRRIMLDWDISSRGSRIAALIQLRLIIRKTSVVADVLPFLDILIEEHT